MSSAAPLFLTHREAYRPNFIKLGYFLRVSVKFFGKFDTLCLGVGAFLFNIFKITVVSLLPALEAIFCQVKHWKKTT